MGAGAGAPGAHDVQVEPAAPLLQGIRGEAPADRGARGRAVQEIEAPVVLGAFQLRSDHEAVAKVGVAVRAHAVGRVKTPFRVAAQRIGSSSVVEPDHLGGPQVGGGADLDPARGVGLGVRGAGALAEAGPRRRKGALDVVGRIPGLPEERRDDLPPGIDQARVGLGAVVLHQGVQPGKGVVGNQREHVVLHVVVHVPVEVPVDRAPCTPSGS